MINEETTTFGLSSEKLVKLLSIGTDVVPTVRMDDSLRAQQLEMILGGKLPIEPSLLESVPEFVRQMDDVAGFLAGNGIGQMLIDAQTDIYLIRRIKEYGQKQSASDDEPCRRDAAIVIYYAAIANALLYHDVRITSSSHEDIDKSLTLLLKKTWLDPDIAELFKKVRRLCRDFIDRQHRGKTS